MKQPEMIRLKTTTPKGAVLLSPFIFQEKEAKRRIKSAAKTFERKFKDKNKTELIKVSKYPQDAIWTVGKYGKDEILIERLIEQIRVLELEWEEL